MPSTTAFETSNYNKNLQNCLSNHLKIFGKEISPLHNPDYNNSINKKIKFVKWILKAIKSDEKIPYETLVVMIDTEIILQTRLQLIDTIFVINNCQYEQECNCSCSRCRMDIGPQFLHLLLLQLSNRIIEYYVLI